MVKERKINLISESSGSITALHVSMPEADVVNVSDSSSDEDNQGIRFSSMSESDDN